ncbi:MAG TPA: oligosaccharide flippase family protein [Polyangia bacterium]|nr:oligosaccharide flippase family protein [Polyangia bacterium]
MTEPTRTQASPPPDRASDARHIARSGVLQLLSAVGQGLLPVTHILVARLFGAVVFGAYQASVAILDVLTRAGQVGSMGGMHRFIAAHRAAGEEELTTRALGTGIRMTVTVSSVLALGLALLARPIARAWHEPHLASTLPIMAPAVLLAATTLVLVNATLGAKVARMSLYVRGIGEPLLLLTAVVLAWAFGGGLRNLAIAHVSTALVVTAMATAACARVFGGARLRQALRAEQHPSFVRFALPLGASDLMSAVLQRADTLLVASFAGLDALAVYTAAEFITRVIANPRYLFDYIIAPVVSEALATRDLERVRYNLALVTRWVFTACLPVAVTIVVLRAEVLGLYGATFVAGTGTLVILAITNTIVACLGLTPYVLAMGGRSRLFLINNTCAAALNIAVGLVLVPRMGIPGAAIAVLVSTGGFQVALTIEAWLIERVHPFTKSLLKPMAAALIAFAVEYALRASLHPGAGRVTLVIAAGAVSFLAALFALGLGAEEREVVRKLVARLRRR